MERIQVRFEGGGTGAGEPSWGQREVHGVGGHAGRHMTMGGAATLPPGVGAQEFAAGFGLLISRHPALRTRFEPGPDNLLRRQVVRERGEVWLDVVDCDGPDRGRVGRGRGRSVRRAPRGRRRRPDGRALSRLSARPAPVPRDPRHHLCEHRADHPAPRRAKPPVSTPSRVSQNPPSSAFTIRIPIVYDH